jgi:hypothetical protein
MESPETMFCYIWEFRVNPLRIDEFESAYGPDGLWTRLFKKAPDYIRTELLEDSVEMNRYITIDYWVDRSAYEQFKQDFSAEFESLDKACQSYTESERHIGDFGVR